MNCVKCGRKTQPDQVFCPECLEVMAQYPVKPGVVVQIPQRATVPAPKKQPRRRPTDEETLQILQRQNRMLLRLLILALVLCAVLGAVSGKLMTTLAAKNAVGRNYTTITTTAPSGTE